MDNRREFFQKLVAAGVGVVPALKQSYPGADSSEPLDPKATYLVVVPNIGPNHAHELQEWLNRIGEPKFIVLPVEDIQIYKL